MVLRYYDIQARFLPDVHFKVILPLEDLPVSVHGQCTSRALSFGRCTGGIIPVVGSTYVQKYWRHGRTGLQKGVFEGAGTPSGLTRGLEKRRYIGSEFEELSSMQEAVNCKLLQDAAAIPKIRYVRTVTPTTRNVQDKEPGRCGRAGEVRDFNDKEKREEGEVKIRYVGTGRFYDDQQQHHVQQQQTIMTCAWELPVVRRRSDADEREKNVISITKQKRREIETRFDVGTGMVLVYLLIRSGRRRPMPDSQDDLCAHSTHKRRKRKSVHSSIRWRTADPESEISGQTKILDRRKGSFKRGEKPTTTDDDPGTTRSDPEATGKQFKSIRQRRIRLSQQAKKHQRTSSTNTLVVRL
ncbi:hypothetical protein FISHEDRAFT_56436 [Fistulina hepatica ATCC 64428]|uniref:Uncharacterized protein n=1 Tax=Fistulina hepatica ATCC 64428 TaxID=1128425 RepID=A0A0D7AJ30_9AGAR|nr:hypothetical protein FISHEDRAFT_56436 [Fistulina hepatica ATCC 64428]